MDRTAHGVVWCGIRIDDHTILTVRNNSVYETLYTQKHICLVYDCIYRDRISPTHTKGNDGIVGDNWRITEYGVSIRVQLEHIERAFTSLIRPVLNIILQSRHELTGLSGVLFGLYVAWTPEREIIHSNIKYTYRDTYSYTEHDVEQFQSFHLTFVPFPY